MSNKQRIDQLNHVIALLKENHKKETANLARLQQIILRKQDSVNRIIAYRAEYEKMHTNSISMMVPSLMQNMSAFMKKLGVAITDERNAIDRIEHEKKQVINKVEEWDKKIKAIISKLEALQLNERIKMENREAEKMDDLNAQSKSREPA